MREKVYAIAICDDDDKMCSFIEKILLEYAKKHGIEIIADIYNSGIRLLEELPVQLYDMLFLDICMKDSDGISIGREIRKKLYGRNIKITYISSFKDYALQLFRLHPYDFLIKPIKEAEVVRILDELIEIVEEDNKIFQYRINGNYHRIPYHKILYFYSTDKHVCPERTG